MCFDVFTGWRCTKNNTHGKGEKARDVGLCCIVLGQSEWGRTEREREREREGLGDLKNEEMVLTLESCGWLVGLFYIQQLLF